MSDYILTAYCLAYNHEKYIKKTLEGFVNQKTEYKYKVIVHDDASTDNTASIIREYAEKYPDIIFPIFQTENQYSKGIKILDAFIKPHLEGKYVAICEGDDYWCDENKLQLQIDYMEKNPDCSMCGHNTELINGEGETIKPFNNPCLEEKDYSAEQIIEARGGALIHTSAMVCKRELRTGLPDSFKMKGVGDYPLSIWLAINGRIHYFGKVMSKYRLMVKGSWTERMKNNPEKKREFEQSAIQALEKMDEYTEGKYKKSFSYAIKVSRFELLSKFKKAIGAVFDSDYRKMLIKRLKYRKVLLKSMKDERK